MALPSAGQPISFSNIRTEFGSIPSGPISFNDLYRSGSHIRDRHGINNNIPTSGQISLSNFAGLYLEGSALQKLQNFRTYRASGTITKGTQQGEVIVSHTGSNNVNNPNDWYQSYNTVYNTQNKTQWWSQSEWTTIVGVAGMPGGSLRSNPITTTYTHTQNYNNHHNGNAGITVDIVNRSLTRFSGTFGNVSYQYTRQATDKWALGHIIMLSGKWEFNRRYVATGSGWGINPLGIPNNAPSVTLARNELAFFARERGGDGASSGWWNGTNCNYIHDAGWWYNTGCVGMTWIDDNTTTSTPIYCYNEQPDATWILREVL